MYYLGLDMGTNSVGWAVTDKQYNVLRAKGKDLWGIREFEEALTAVDRRTKRISRRRRQREQVRSGLLKSYFDEEIRKVDPLFFTRLDNSKYILADKDETLESGKYAIFADDNYTDADYYKEYPTIFHLRKELIYSKEPHDIRLVYLAISNMFKHRGHFLDASLSDSADSLPQIDILYGQLLGALENLTEDNHFNLPASPEYIKITEILGNRSISKTRKSEELQDLLGVDKKQTQTVELIKCICGRKINAKKLFVLEETEEKIDIEFASASYDEDCEGISQLLGNEYYEVVEIMKSIYDIGLLYGILGNDKGENGSIPYLSEVRVNVYKNHKNDLMLLKKVMKKYCSEQAYDAMFRVDEKGSYSSYVKSFNSKGEKERRKSEDRKQEDLYKSIKKVLDKADKNDEDVIVIFNKIEIGSFLPKQLTSDNGVIPNQIHARELRKILSNAENYLPFLKEKDEYNLTISERIIKLFTFHLPYYIGPTSENSKKYNGNGWVVRKEAGQVLPWNLEQKIDVDATATQFIERLIRNCTYISGEKVVPKESLIYQKYCVLNEINNIRINGERISIKLKQQIYNEVFKKGKRVTKKGLCKYLVSQGIITEEEQVSGIDTNINSALTSYGKFYSIFGNNLEKDSYQNMVEDIIKQGTIFGDSKKRLEKIISEKYGEVINDPMIMKRILGLKFKDWGNLSKEFLELEGCDENGEIMSLISALWNTQYNMMELINSDQFKFKQNLVMKQTNALKVLEDFEVEDLDELYFSAPVKRMIWQTLKLIRELKQILGEYPDRIFVEMTRKEDEKGDKGRKDSRKKMFLELYKKVKDETNDWLKLIEDEDASGRLKSKKMYLYLTQMGCSMYTGKEIDLDKLFNSNFYDIDHIYPRSLVKDDNLANNLVLVEKEYNSGKSDIYPLNSKIRNNEIVQNLWKRLLKQKLISEEKYRRLTGTQSFSEEQKADFIARQLVETSQGTKGVADLLKQLLPDTTLVYAKANNVSRFRADNNFCKSRIVNEFHHAQDAYLNIVVGNAYYVKFTQNPLNFIKKEFSRDPKANHYNLSKMFQWNIERKGEVAWIAGKTGTIQTVNKMMSKNTPLLTRMSFESHGKITNETVYGAAKAKKDVYYPLKTSDAHLCDVTKYGGFSDIQTAYFALVEYPKKDKIIRCIEVVPVYIALQENVRKGALEVYFSQRYPGSKVLLKKIKMGALIERNGYRMYMTGKQNGGAYIVCRNAVNLCVCKELGDYICELEKMDVKLFDEQLVDAKLNVQLYDELIHKHQGLWSRRPQPITEILVNGRSNFIQLGLKEQVITLLEILNTIKIPSTNCNLEKIGGKSNGGSMYISKVVDTNNHVVLINQSVTGIYETSIDLLSL